MVSSGLLVQNEWYRGGVATDTPRIGSQAWKPEEKSRCGAKPEAVRHDARTMRVSRVWQRLRFQPGRKMLLNPL